VEVLGVGCALVLLLMFVSKLVIAGVSTTVPIVLQIVRPMTFSVSASECGRTNFVAQINILEITDWTLIFESGFQGRRCYRFPQILAHAKELVD
jgi:hypothetical protein